MDTTRNTSTTAAPAAWRTYIRATVFLLPPFAIWLFATMVLLPRISRIWADAGLAGSRPQWLLDLSYGFMDNGRLVVYAVVLLLFLLEFRVSAWPRYRRMVVECVTFAINTAVLIGLATFCTTALLAVSYVLEGGEDKPARPASALDHPEVPEAGTQS